MAQLFGKNISKKDILQRVGDISQIASARPYELLDGKARRLRACDVKTGSGFQFTVLEDRGLDISHASFNGVPLAYISYVGEVSPLLFDRTGLNWLRSFTGGLLTTCGMSQFGPPCVDEGEDFGLHGRINNIPAQNVIRNAFWDDDEYVMEVRGQVVEAAVMKEYIVLHRSISTKMGASKLILSDTVENRLSKPQPHMVLYHVNFGYPVVDAGSIIYSHASKVVPRDETAAQGLDTFAQADAVTGDYEEQVFFHTMCQASDGKAVTAIINEDFNDGKGIGCYVRYNPQELPFFNQWKMHLYGVNVMGLEPANCPLATRSDLRKSGKLPMLEPGESTSYTIEIGVLTGVDDINSFKKKYFPE